jgi:hypothetical protein
MLDMLLKQAGIDPEEMKQFATDIAELIVFFRQQTSAMREQNDAMRDDMQIMRAQIFELCETLSK